MPISQETEQRKRLAELRLRWKQQDLVGEKVIINHLREQLRLHEQKADILIHDLNVMRRDIALL